MGDLIEQFDDHESRVSRFIEQWRSKPDLVLLTRIYLRQLQDLEDAIFEVILERVLANAVGVQLNILGKIVQQPRTTSDDNRFRTAIRARIAINLSDSTPEDLITIARLLLADGEAFKIREEPPAQVRITVIDPLTSGDHDLIQELLDEGDPGGVRLLLDWNNALASASDKLLLSNETTGSAGGGSLGSTTGPTTNPGGLASVIGPE